MSVSNIPGDLFRKRHDIVKTVINSFCVTSGVRAECEVFGIFRDIIPVQALAEEDVLEGGGAGKGYSQTSDWSCLHQLGNQNSDLQS